MSRKEKSVLFAMPRASLFGLLVTMIACYVPHASRLPGWMSAFAAFCILCRLMVYYQKVSFPHGFLKAILAFAGTWLLIREYGTLMAPDGGVAFLLLAYFLKALEMHYRRDAMLLMLLSFFVIPMQFLYDSNLGGALWVFFCYLLIIATLISFHQQDNSHFHFVAFIKGIKLVAVAIPITIILFLFFPRLPPFWNLPSSKPTQTIGLSDQIDTETLGELFKSGKVAFRVEFENGSVDRRLLYWKGVVLEHFNGIQWQVRESYRKLPLTTQSKPSDTRYKIYLEPTQQRYLFGLSPVHSINGIRANRMDNDMLLAENTIHAQEVYSVSSDLRTGQGGQIPVPDVLQRNTLLPVKASPRTREQAAVLFKTADKNTEKMIEEINRWIFTSEFSYTLSPPPTSGDRIDDFLFRTRSGYCSHYASAAAVMLRSVGIPARVIGGYQGGEYQAAGNYWIVHQYDAHAWVEYFSPEKGWAMFDPTAAVSPLRIESGMEQMGLSEEGDAFSTYAINQWPLIKQLRRSLDYLNYQWIVNVVGYQQQEQTQLFEDWFGGADLQHFLPWLGSGIAGICALLMGYVHWRDRPLRPHEIDALMLLAFHRIKRRFRPRANAETIAAYCQAYAETGANNGQALLELCEQYHRLRFSQVNNPLTPPSTKTQSSENGRLRDSLSAFKAGIKKFK